MVLECDHLVPFLIKHILGIKRIFPCSFGNKCMRLLTCVCLSTYSMYAVNLVELACSLHCVQGGK